MNQKITNSPATGSTRNGFLTRLNAPVYVVISAVLAVFLVGASILAPLIAPQNPYDPAVLDLLNSGLPPTWLDGGDPAFLFGTDKQGRDILSGILYGTRLSLLVGVLSVSLSVFIGTSIGIISGVAGGRIDQALTGLSEIQFAFPPILAALLLAGVLRGSLDPDLYSRLAIPALIIAIGFPGWVQFARIARGVTLIEKQKEYTLAAKVTGFPPLYILRQHILPNVFPPILLVAMTQMAVSIIYEATLSFLGLGTPPTQPSLGALIQNGSQYMYSGDWWLVVFPGATLLVLLVSLTIVGDWLRDMLNPRLR